MGKRRVRMWNGSRRRLLRRTGRDWSFTMMIERSTSQGWVMDEDMVRSRLAGHPFVYQARPSFTLPGYFAGHHG
jgi:hypothetical protein